MDRHVWVKWLLVPVAIWSVFSVVKTVDNQVAFVQTSENLAVQVAEFCPRGEGEYEIEVIVQNGSRQDVVVEKYVFRIHHQEQLVASTVVVDKTTLTAGSKQGRRLTLATNLGRDACPELTKCGVEGGWRVSGDVTLAVDFARQRIKIHAQAGGT